MKRIINSENYRLERNASLSPSHHFYNRNHYHQQQPVEMMEASSSSSSTTSSSGSSTSSATSQSSTPKYRVSRSREKIKLTQKYRIVNARDPHSGTHYSLSQIVSLKLINKYTSSFCLPSTGQLIALDEAIQLGYVNAELIDEFLETSNESYEFIQHSDINNNNNNNNDNNCNSNNFMEAKQTDNKINSILCDKLEKENKLKDNHVSSRVVDNMARIVDNLNNKTSLSSINTIIKVILKIINIKLKISPFCYYLMLLFLLLLPLNLPYFNR